VAAHRNDPFGAELPRGQHAEKPDRAVADHGDGPTGPRLGGDRGEPAGAEHVGGGQQARDHAARPAATSAQIPIASRGVTGSSARTSVNGQPVDQLHHDVRNRFSEGSR
jgi:hypothetical protein